MNPLVLVINLWMNDKEKHKPPRKTIWLYFDNEDSVNNKIKEMKKDVAYKYATFKVVNRRDALIRIQ